MRLVNLHILRPGADARILELVARLEMHCVEEPSLIILDHIAGPSWVSVHLILEKIRIRDFWGNLRQTFLTYFGAIGSCDLDLILLSGDYLWGTISLR